MGKRITDLTSLSLPINDNDKIIIERSKKSYNANISEILSTKQDVISDLDTIRTNAAKGATALQSVPSEYITETELNGKGYLTSHQDISGKANVSDLTSHTNNSTVHITSNERTAWNNKVDMVNGKALISTGEIARLATVHNYDDTSVLESIDNLSSTKADKSAIPTKVSQLSNDKNYLTAVPDTYATKDYVTSEINNAMLEGGDTEIDLTPYALNSDLALKADKTELHEHENKSVLDLITMDTLSAMGEITTSLNGPRNFYNPETDTIGVYLANSGKTTYANSIYNTTDYITILPGQTLYFYGGNGRYDVSSGMRFVAFYDTNYQAITDLFINNANATTSVTSDDNRIAYIRATYQTNAGWGLGYIENVYPGADLEYGAVPDSSLWEKPQKIDVFLPDNFYCAAGTTLELYNDQVCLQADKLHVRWNCEYGKSLERKFSITGTDTLVGQQIPLTFEVYNDYNVLKYEKTVTIHIVASSVPSTTCVPIGDSWTNGKPWPAEVINLSNGNISFLGKFSATTKDSDGNWRAHNHEGRSGFAAYSYNTKSPYTFGNAGETTCHVFYNTATNRFDWNNYVNTILGGIQPGAVMLQMGINGIRTDNTDMIAHEVNIINMIRQDNANIPIFVTLTAYKGNQNGLGVQQSSDGHATNKGLWDYEEKQKVMNYCSLLYEAIKDMVGVYVIPLNVCFDAKYNYGAVETQVNPRCPVTELMPVEAVHPQDYGYYQMADIVYSVMCANLN